MILESRKINKNLVLLKRRHLVTNYFLSLRCGFLDGSPKALQHCLDVFGKANNVFVYG